MRRLFGEVESPMHPLGAWVHVGDYHICVHEVRNETLEETGGLGQRVVYIEVGYQNESSAALGHRPNQWYLHDEQGYGYDNEMSGGPLLRPRSKVPLMDGAIAPGRTVRGWLAFKVPPDAQPHYIHFITGFLDSKVADFAIEP